MDQTSTRGPSVAACEHASLIIAEGEREAVLLVGCEENPPMMRDPIVRTRTRIPTPTGRRTVNNAMPSKHVDARAR